MNFPQNVLNIIINDTVPFNKNKFIKILAYWCGVNNYEINIESILEFIKINEKLFTQEKVFLLSKSITDYGGNQKTGLQVYNELILYGYDVKMCCFTKEDLVYAIDKNDILKIYNINDVLNEINNLPKQFETLVGERGTTLSGGQKQRVAIARALLKKPNIYIFDDCLSAVDANTEQIILSNLKSYIQNKTALFITHRIFYSFQFDLIIYLEDGKIAEMGTHDSLLAKNGLYAELYRVQQTQEQH